MTETLGDVLTAARERAGLSQTELAKRTGVDRSYVATWEKFGSEPSHELRRKIAKILGIDPLELYPGLELLTAEEMRFLEIHRMMAAPGQKRLAMLLDGTRFMMRLAAPGQEDLPAAPRARAPAARRCGT
jgi:transcriptional regulator with XRE-family HTH domain